MNHNNDVCVAPIGETLTYKYLRLIPVAKTGYVGVVIRSGETSVGLVIPCAPVAELLKRGACFMIDDLRMAIHVAELKLLARISSIRRALADYEELAAAGISTLPITLKISDILVNHISALEKLRRLK